MNAIEAAAHVREDVIRRHAVGTFESDRAWYEKNVALNDNAETVRILGPDYEKAGASITAEGIEDMGDVWARNFDSLRQLAPNIEMGVYSGWALYFVDNKCPTCRGYGRTTGETRREGVAFITPTHRCSDCGGTGIK